MNHRLLQTQVEKVRALEENAGRRALVARGKRRREGAGGKRLGVGGEPERLLVDLDEVDSKMDPTYVLPPQWSPPTLVLEKEDADSTYQPPVPPTPCPRSNHVWLPLIHHAHG
jgi:hypothetical protein